MKNASQKIFTLAGAGVLFIVAVIGVFLTAVRAPQPTVSPEAVGAVAKREEASTSVRDSAAEARTARESEIARRQAEILDRLAAGSPLDINTVYFQLLPALVAVDPAAAAAWAQAQENPQWREDLMMVVAQSWAGLDPDAAQDWAANLPNPPGKPRERDNMVSYVAFEVGETDAARAVQVLQETNINPERREVMVQNFATQWAAGEAGEIQPLTDWLKTLPAEEGRDELLARVAAAQAPTDPAAAADLISASIAPGPTQQRVALDVLKVWAWTDPDAAAQWVERFPRDSEMFDLALQTLSETVRQRNGLIPPPAQNASATPAAASAAVP